MYVYYVYYSLQLCLSRTTSDILSLVYQKLKRSREPEHTQFVDNLSCVGGRHGQWRSNGVGKLGKVQEAPECRGPEFQANLKK